MFKLFKKTSLLIIFFSIPILSQSFGFGCLGFVGGFGGFSYQQFNAGGLNSYVNTFNSRYSEYIEKNMGEFGKATGYRIGVNVFRANFSGLFITAKGFYQQLHEERDAIVYQTAFGINYKYNLKIISWGIGADLGIPVTDFLSWKIIDGSLLINSARFTETSNSTEQGTEIMKFDNDKTEVGYTIGTGFIIDIIEGYLSLEGIAAYSQFAFDKMKNENGSQLSYIPEKNIISEKFLNSGGFNIVIQLNLGFPI